MSNYRQPNGDDYPHASKKHVEDPITLFDASRYDGDGYTVECILKTIVLVDGNCLSKNHKLDDFSKATLYPAEHSILQDSNVHIQSYNYTPAKW